MVMSSPCRNTVKRRGGLGAEPNSMRPSWVKSNTLRHLGQTRTGLLTFMAQLQAPTLLSEQPQHISVL